MFSLNWVRLAAVAAVSLALAACASASTGPGPGKPVKVRSTPQNPIQRPAVRPAPRFTAIPGLEGIIGADADQLTRMFGAPRLDIVEDDARKLQWSGTACVLDIYFYPPQAGGRPQAAYVDARRGDGREVDRAACVQALKK